MLAVHGITKTFFPDTPNEVRALRGVDLEIDDGAFVVVIGMNGSGKSTLLNAVAGTFPVDAGTIHLSNREITRWPEHRLTTLMVTRSMQQAARLGDRLIMMVRGRVIHDYRGAEKQRLRPEDLLARFEDVRRAEQLDESAAEMLRAMYV